jgi:hypothetical protein
VSNKTKQIKGADQRRNVREDQREPIRDQINKDESSNQEVSSEGPRINTEMKTQ